MPKTQQGRNGAAPYPAPLRWSLSVSQGDGEAQPVRVCDRCIRKKVKCDLKYPSCSACNDVGCVCKYSSSRKRPGPPKGCPRKRRIISKPARASQDEPQISQQVPVEMTYASPSIVFDTPVSLTEPETLLSEVNISPGYSPQLSVEQRCELNEKYASTINMVFPLFQNSTIFDQLRDGAISDPLLYIMHALASKAIETQFWHGNANLDLSLSYFIDTTMIEAESVTDPLALGQWRIACLLAWHSLHQTPSKNEAMRIAVLTRKAYQCGLHQIDSIENRASFGWDVVEAKTLEDWRLVWWCVNMLDCHISFSTAVPHQVEFESVRTALPQHTQWDTNDPNAMLPKHFLPPDRDGVWKLAHDITTTEGSQGFGLHMSVSFLLKEAVAARRIYNQNPNQKIRGRISAIADSLSALQLALPRGYMNQARDLLCGESDAAYHCRLLTMLKIYSTQLLLRLPYRLLDGAQWQTQWQETLEICYRMVVVLQQWDVICTPAIDPAVCYISLSLIMMLHLHEMSSGASRPAVRDQLARRKVIVKLFLQNYTSFSALAQFLLDCYEALTRKVAEPLHQDGINHILEQFNGPLHQKWLNYLSITQPVYPNFNTQQMTYTNIDAFATTQDLNGYITPDTDFGLWKNFPVSLF